MARSQTTFVVTRSEWLTESMIRVHLGGPEFEAFTPNEFTDAYVKLVFDHDGGQVRRSYTVRSVDPVAQEIAIDFFYHGDVGVAGPWAAAARAGDRIDALGPGGAYRPRTDADWHLFAGDEAALPAIATGLAALPLDAAGQAFIEVAGPDAELPLDVPAGVEVTWLHRGTRTPGTLLAGAVRAAEWRNGQAQVFVHGEAESVMRVIRPYLRRERAVAPEWATSVSGYWRLGDSDENFRRWKREFAEQEAVAATR